METTDYYRKWRPYKLFTKPGKSAAILTMDVNIKLVRELKITLNHCKTNCNGVVDIYVNDAEFMPGYTGIRWDNFGEQTFTIPRRLLKPGANTVKIILNRYSKGVYWLSDVKVETIMQ
jgi:hypothetical protein